MLTRAFYTELMAGLRQGAAAPGLFIAVGSGRVAWDAAPPAEERDVTTLVGEVARVAVPPEAIVFLDAAGQPTDDATPRLRVAGVFGSTQGVGTLRESGLFGGAATTEPGSGVLLSYFTHPRIEKAEGMTLTRTFSLDVTPRPIAPGSRVTRWLGNTQSLEVHDLEQTTGGCQIDEIRTDRRFYFPSLQAALDVGYDACAYCLGRERSKR